MGVLTVNDISSVSAIADSTLVCRCTSVLLGKVGCTHKIHIQLYMIVNCETIYHVFVHAVAKHIIHIIKYICIVSQIAPSRLIVCDMLVGSVERMIDSNPLLRFLQWIGVLRHVIWRRQDSYSVEMQVCSRST